MKQPKIRLKGFEGEWKETTLAESGQCFSGIGFPDNEQGGGKGIPFYKVSDMNNVGNEKIMKYSNNYVTLDQVKRNGWKVCTDVPAIFFAKVGAAVLLNRKRLVLEPCLCDNNTMLYSFDKRLWDTLFCQSYFETIDLAKLVQVGSLPSYNGSMVGKITITLPSIDEQQAIGSYFQHLDSLIQNTTKKIESLKQVKLASLQSMFPQEGETTPRVRFKGFEGEWEKKRLNECLKVCKDKNLCNIFSKEDVLSVSDDYGICNQIELLGRSYAGKSVANYGILKTGDVVYTKSPLKVKPYGIIKTNHGQTGIVSTLYAIYSPIEGTSSDFIECYFDYADRMNHYIHPLINKGAKNDMKVSSENALKGFILIPTYKEQIKIASYFCSLNQHITYQSQRLDKLKQIKSACLDNMFV